MTRQQSIPKDSQERFRARHCREELIDEKIRDFQAGHEPEAAFQRIFECYYRRIRGYFSRRVNNAEVVQDLTQTAFLSIYRGLGGFEHRSKFDSYLFQILRNTFLRHLEACKRRPVEDTWSAEEGDESAANPHAFAGPARATVEEDALHRERRQALWRAIAALPERKRQCMILHYGQGLSYKEIALALRVQSGTVAATLNQARVRLQHELRTHFGELPVEPTA